MPKINISFRVHSWHYKAIKHEISKGNTLTGLFEELLNEKFPVSSKFK